MYLYGKRILYFNAAVPYGRKKNILSLSQQQKNKKKIYRFTAYGLQCRCSCFVIVNLIIEHTSKSWKNCGCR